MKGHETLPADGNVLPFRRPRSAVRVRRRSRWRSLLGPLGKAIALVGLPLAAGLWLFTAPTFAFARVEVMGEQRVAPAWIESTLAPLVGENLWRLELSAVERLVLANPWVAAVRIEKRLPDALRVELTERQPAALLRTAEGLVVLDTEGRPVAPWEPHLGGGDLLLVSLGTTVETDFAGALAIAAELERAAPSWGQSLSEIVVLADDEFRLYLGAVRFPVAVRAGTLAERLPPLIELLPELERRYPELALVDLRFERRIVFQPIAERS